MKYQILLKIVCYMCQ